jgi:hypothetical protein
VSTGKERGLALSATLEAVVVKKYIILLPGIKPQTLSHETITITTKTSSKLMYVNYSIYT